MKNRVLMVPDCFFGPSSGATAARSAVAVWRDIGCEVSIYAERGGKGEVVPESTVALFPRSPFRGWDHLLSGRALAEFESVLDQAQPSHVFFLGSAYSKPAGFFRLCSRHGIRTLALWWTQDFFCARGYACLPDGPCERCIGGNYTHSLVHGCSYVTSDRSLRRLAGGALSRPVLKRELLAVDVLMGSTQEQLDRFCRYGADRTRLVLCPLFFDRSRTDRFVPRRGDYFVCYGQSRMEKGWHLLREILTACPGVRVLLPFARSDAADAAIAQFGLEPLVEDGRIEVLRGVRWETGVAEVVANSRGVLIPSIWPTTTEYTLLESLGLAKPVIAFDVGVHREVFVSGENGLVAKLGDTRGLADHINRLARDDRAYDLLSLGARALFERMTDPEAYRTAFRTALEVTTRDVSG